MTRNGWGLLRGTFWGICAITAAVTVSFADAPLDDLVGALIVAYAGSLMMAFFIWLNQLGER